MRLLSATICLLVVSTALFAAQTPATVTVKAQALVMAGELVRVKDVAQIQAPAELAKRIGETVVSAAPPPGAERIIDASYVRMKLKAVVADRLLVDGAAKVTVTGRCVRLSSQQLAEEARAFVLSRLPKDNRTYEVVTDRSPRELVLAEGGDVQVRPKLLGSAARLGPNTVAIDAVVDGRVAATTSALVQVKAVADTLVATAPISQGEALTSQNTTWDQRDVTKAPQAIVMAEGGKSQDWIARRTIAAGSVISLADVTLPPIVRQGDTVTVVVTCGRVTLRTTGQSKDSGRIGDGVRVKCSVSREDVRARITGPGMVEVSR